MRGADPGHSEIATAAITATTRAATTHRPASPEGRPDSRAHERSLAPPGGSAVPATPRNAVRSDSTLTSLPPGRPDGSEAGPFVPAGAESRPSPRDSRRE